MSSEESGGHSGSSVLYDVLVYNEWHQQEEEQEEPREEEEATRQWSLRDWSSRFLRGNRQCPLSRLRQLRELRTSWQLSVSPDAALVAVAQEQVLEILSRSTSSSSSSSSSPGPSYVSVSRAELPPDNLPQLRRMAWTEDAAFVAVTTSNGRVLVYDAAGDLIFPIISNNLPEWNSASDQSASYCRVEFVELGRAGPEWHSELLLVDNSGRMNTFLCSRSGYQELASSPALAKAYPSGVAAVSVLPPQGLLYACGQAKAGVGVSGISCWRMIDQEPFLERVELQGEEESSGGFWRTFRSGSSSTLEDLAYLMSVSGDGRSLATVHMSGDINVWSLPGLVRRSVIPLADQACHDDVNPHCLQKGPSSSAFKSIFLKHPLRFHPTDIRWWDDSSMVIARLSGGLTILPVQDPSTNLLGESAEFFAPSCELSQCFEFGFFALEVDGNKRFLEEAPSDKEKLTLWEHVTDIADSIFRGRGEEEEEEEEAKHMKHEVTYRLLYFQSTSPEELFQKKIDDEEYGEAVILARHFGLDCDRVYVRQWKGSDHSQVAAQDYLSKVVDPATVLRECATTVPATAEACRALLSFGLARAEVELAGGAGGTVTAAKLLLQSFLSQLDLYLSVVGSEEDYSAKEFGDFRTRSPGEIAVHLALKGNAGRLKRLFASVPLPAVGPHLAEVLSALPEPFDPLPEVADLVVSLADSAAASEVPEPAWFRSRSAEMVLLSGQSDFALNLLHLAANVPAKKENSADPAFYHHLSTFHALVFEKKELSASFDRVRTMGDKSLLKGLLEKPKPNAVRVFKTLGLPFLDRVEQCSSGSSVALFHDFVVDVASRDFTTASDLIRVVAENLEETWFSPSDLKALGMAVVWNSSPSADVQSLASFLAYLQQYCKEVDEDEEFALLLEAVRTLGVVSKYDPTATIAGVKEAQGRGGRDRAKILVDRLLHMSKERLREKAYLRPEVLHDVLTVSVSCRDLDLRYAFETYCKTLMELDDVSAIDLVKDTVLVSTKQRRDSLGKLGMTYANGSGKEIKKVMSHFGLGPPSGSTLSRLASEAALTYLDAARDCADDTVSLAERCLGILPEEAGESTGGGIDVRRARDMVLAVKILSRFEFMSPLQPAKLRGARFASEVGQLLYAHLRLPKGSLSKRTTEELIDFSSCVSRSLRLDPVETKAHVVSAVARVAMESGEGCSCLSLCNTLMDGALSVGWEVCNDLAEEDAKLAGALLGQDDGDDDHGGGSALRRLRVFSAAHCDEPSRLEEIAKKLLPGKDEEPVRDVVPGFTFGENAFESWDSEAQARKLADIFGDRSAYKVGEVVRPLWDQHVFEQDPALALASTPVGADLEAEEEEDSLLLLRHVLAEAMEKACPLLGRDESASLSLLHLCSINLAGGGSMKALLEMYRSREVAKPRKEVRTPVGVDAQGEQQGGGGTEGDEETVVEVMHPPGEVEEGRREEEVPSAFTTRLPVCVNLAELKDRGVPVGLRTLPACLMRPRGKE